ncbi:hypothetical protein TREPR_2043 [Treponema primitia ZAS-2]|uniref:Uncharacterized protein n=1 Tax=Treponema primitia (strain ATCC BAA-887 / DSM 12427 / ZAS-2) TaxID=545694 RepID=F5YJU2_TREPZ|nr:hypothetical protein [Treponema primitia]AEF83978.1 hypothetical protein TREPR_2043 [Treponema primitia ZAS-2]
MRFYTVDDSLKEAIDKGMAAVRVRVSLDFAGNGVFETVSERDIIEASFFGLKETAGGTTARGELLLDNTSGNYAYSGNGAGREVRVSFSLGEGLPWFQRFVLYVDHKGFQDIRGPGRRRLVRLALGDRSVFLRRSDESRDWTQHEVFTYSVVCDKTQPEKSLVHLIAKRAGIEAADIDCATIPIALPYVKLTKNIWAELSELATAYRCHLECPVEKPLVFAHSPYQAEPDTADDGNPEGSASYIFSGRDIFYLRKTARAERYRNTVRLKINMPVVLEKQEIWRYTDPPVLYDDGMTDFYPFRLINLRSIVLGEYEAKYRVRDEKGNERAVLYADNIDTVEEATERLMFDGCSFAYSHYDVTTRHDRAYITIEVEKRKEGDLVIASIHGRSIVLDLNRSCFLRDSNAVDLQGTCALNVTGSYFSEDVVNGRPQYEDWAARELADRLQERREFTVKTHRALFHGRVGATVQIKANGETVQGTVNAFSLRYKRDAAFVAAFRIMEE